MRIHGVSVFVGTFFSLLLRSSYRIIDRWRRIEGEKEIEAKNILFSLRLYKEVWEMSLCGSQFA